MLALTTGGAAEAVEVKAPPMVRVTLIVLAPRRVAATVIVAFRVPAGKPAIFTEAVTVSELPARVEPLAGARVNQAASSLAVHVRVVVALPVLAIVKV